MTALGLCLLSFLAAYWAGKRSLSLGIIALLAVGYFYGIVRANLLSTGSYFMFDLASFGLYASQKWSNLGPRSASLRGWMLALMIWPALLLLLPFQPLLVSLVGLRSAVFFLPMVLLGSRLRGNDLFRLSVGFAALNLIALGFAVAEYFLGLPRFYPLNPSTALIYQSSDVAGGFFRIPATFVHAHAFGGTMVATIPYLVGAWDKAKSQKLRLFTLMGTAAALLGVLLSATRMNFVISAVLVLVAIWNGQMKVSRRAIFVLLIAVMVVVALNNPRFQRFKSLSDTDAVQDRISGSVNRGFFDTLAEYPMGNGLGGGGTNMPFFLQGRVRNPIAMENEYARILSEQGVIGLMLWVGFLTWFLSRTREVFASGPWATSRRLIWGLSLFGLLSGLIGEGMLSSIPETAMLLMGIGFISTRMEGAAEKQSQGVAQGWQPRHYRPVSALAPR